MEIKLLALLSLLPFFRTIGKIKRREDLTCIDFILFFHTIYFVIIPLIGDVKEITYPIVRSSSSIHWYVFIVYNAFAYTLVFIDFEICRKRRFTHSIFYLTKFIRNFLARIEIDKSVLILTSVLIGLELYSITSSILFAHIVGGGAMEDIRQSTLENNTPVQMFVKGGIHTTRLIAIILLYLLVSRLRESGTLVRYKAVVYLLVCIQVAVQFLISRTYLIESIFLVIILYYSEYRTRFTLSKALKYSIVCGLCVAIGFPIITAIRSANRSLIYDGKITNVFDSFLAGADLIYSGKADYYTSDNKDSRMWNVYQILAYSYISNYEGNGRLMLNAITYGIPKIIYPNKSKTGSQGIIEKETRTNIDIADSVLLAGVMESRLFGFLLASFFFVILVLIYDALLKLFKRYCFHILSIPLALISIYQWLNRVEYTIDGVVPAIIHFILWNVILFVIVKVVYSFAVKRKEGCKRKLTVSL